MEAAVIENLLKSNPTLALLKDKLLALKPGSYCIHRTWGVGEVKKYDPATNKLALQFEGQKELVQMDPGFCASKLEILPETHIIARHRTNTAEIQALIDGNPAELFAQILQNAPHHTMSALEMEATLQSLLGPDYKKWLTTAKKRVAKDKNEASRIQLPEGKTGSYVLHTEAVAADDGILVAFYKTKNVKKKIELAESLLMLEELPEEVRSKLGTVVEELAGALVESRVLTAGEKLQGAWVRNDLAKIAGLDGTQYKPAPSELIKGAFDMGELAGELNSQYHRRMLELVKETHESDWQKIILDLMRGSSGKFTQECVIFLLDNGMDKKLGETMERWLNEQALKAPIIIWVVKNRTARRYSSMLSRLMTPKFFSAILYAIEYEAIQNASTKRIPLVEILSEDKDLIPELLSTATPEVARDLAHTLMMNQGFETLTKRSLLARFIKQFPDIQSLIAAENNQSQQQESLIVSWESLEKRKQEYNDLVQKKIPENKQAIATAREMGDLKENSEYKMARQDQDTLMSMKAQIETEMRVARGTDFSDAPAGMVGIGSIVELENSEGHTTYTVMGAWDGNPKENILSYKTPLAQAMMGKKPGETVKSAGQTYRIVNVKRWADKK